MDNGNVSPMAFKMQACMTKTNLLFSMVNYEENEGLYIG